MWHQGLARVKVTAAAGGGVDVAPPEWGPVFGNASFYNLDPALTPEQREWYSNMTWRLDGEVFRDEPPVFTDVAVQNFCGRYVYATLDTLGWVRFDLGDPLGNPWGEAMAIDHHEGEPYPADVADHPFSEIQFRLDDLAGDRDYTYPRQVRVLQNGQDGVLAVSGACQSMVKRLEYRTVGQTFNYSADEFNGIPTRIFGASACADEDNPGLVTGSGEHVYVYEIDCNGLVSTPLCIAAPLEPPAPPSELPEAPVFEGGSSVREMEIIPSGTVDKLLLFNQGRTITSKTQVNLNPPSFTTLGSRVAADRPGRECWKAKYSILNPDLLLFTSNDGGPPANGVWATCGSGLVNFYSPDSEGGDSRMNHGIFMHQDGQWPVLTTAPEYQGMQFTLATGPKNKYVLRLIDPGDPCGDPAVEPTDVYAWKILSYKHRLDAVQRWFFQSVVNDEYDADTGRKLVFISGTGSVEGILVVDRERLETWVFNDMPPGNGNDLDIADADQGVVIRALNTEPEFDRVPSTDINPATSMFLQLQNYPGSTEVVKLTGKVQTYAPHLFKVPGAQGGPVDSWVLAAPCGYLDNGEQDLDTMGQQLQSYTDNPTWQAPPGFDNFANMLLQFWDVTNPAGILTDPSTSYVAGPNLANALFLDSVELDGRTYLFVADFGGRVHVYDVTDVLWDSTDPVKLVEIKDVTSSYTDDLPNCVWEVVVDRAQWSSGGEDHDEVYVYAAVERVGIEVFHFDPDCAPGDRLKKVTIIQTPGNPRSLVIRDQGGDKTLILSDGEAGFRVLEYDF